MSPTNSNDSSSHILGKTLVLTRISQQSGKNTTTMTTATSIGPRRWAAVAAGAPTSNPNTIDSNRTGTTTTTTTIPAPAPAPSKDEQQQAKVSFKPMDAITLGHSSGSSLAPSEKVALGFSPNYKGDATNPHNRSANISPAESTSLYLTNLPTSTSVKTLLDALTLHGPFGKVWQVYISPPIAMETYHATSAAKVAMFTRRGAEKVFEFVRAGGLVLEGNIIRVAWNRVLVPEQEKLLTGSPYLSRVLVIEGDKEIVNFENLDRYFRERIVFQLQDVRVVSEEKEDTCLKETSTTAGGKGSKKGTRRMEWVFGSYRAQAQTAKMALKRRWPDLSVRYGVDPVAVGPRALSVGGVKKSGVAV